MGTSQPRNDKIPTTCHYPGKLRFFQWWKLRYLKGKTLHSEAACAALIHACTQYGAAQPLITGSLTLFSIIGAKETRKESEGEKWKEGRKEGGTGRPAGCRAAGGRGGNALGMHRSSRAGPAGTAQGSGDHCMSLSCHLWLRLSKTSAGIFSALQSLSQVLPFSFSISAPPRSSRFSHHFCRPWRDSQISINNCLKALKAKGNVSLANHHVTMERPDGISCALE